MGNEELLNQLLAIRLVIITGENSKYVLGIAAYKIGDRCR